jgi:hypothetical protein
MSGAIPPFSHLNASVDSDYFVVTFPSSALTDGARGFIVGPPIRFQER